MIMNNSTKRTLAGIALAVSGVVTAGMLAIGSASAQGSAGVSPLSSPLQTPRPDGGHGIFGRELDVLAQALGIDEASLKAELASGKSIAEIAAARNVPVTAVVDAVVAERQAQLAKAVADGKLTQVQADEKLAKYETQVIRAVTTAPPAGGPREPRDPRHFHDAEPVPATTASGSAAGAAATVAPLPQGGPNDAAATAAPPQQQQQPPRTEQNGGGRGGNGGGNGGGGRGPRR